MTQAYFAEYQDRVEIADFFLATTRLLSSLKEIVATITDLKNHSGDDFDFDLANQFGDFLVKNQEYLRKISSSAPALLDILIQKFLFEENPSFPSESVQEWFNQMIESSVEMFLAFLSADKEGDILSHLSTLETIVELFIQDWLLPHIDKKMGL